MGTQLVAGNIAAGSRRLRQRLLALAALVAAIALVAAGPIAQFADYHAFADRRSWLGIANAGDVLSNLPFLAVGAWGLWRLRHLDSGGATPAWRAFAVAIFCTGIGSAAYHLMPADGALVFDRLPIAAACALLACAFVAERAEPRAARWPVLVAATALGAGSVAWWWATQDLRPYLYVQFLPMLFVAVGLGLRLPARVGGLQAKAWWIAVGVYAVAKGFEVADHAVFDAAGIVSGHTLKHLFAAAGAAVLLGAAAPGTAARGTTSGSRR